MNISLILYACDFIDGRRLFVEHGRSLPQPPPDHGLAENCSILLPLSRWSRSFGVVIVPVSFNRRRVLLNILRNYIRNMLYISQARSDDDKTKNVKSATYNMSLLYTLFEVKRFEMLYPSGLYTAVHQFCLYITPCSFKIILWCLTLPNRIVCWSMLLFLEFACLTAKYKLIEF